MDFNLNDLFKNPGIVYNPEIDGAKEFASEISGAFYKKGLSSFPLPVFDTHNMTTFQSFVIAIGGDGTLLKCARHYGKLNTPVFGFNMGRLGYLSQALPDEIDFVVEKLKSGDFRIEERLMLKSSAGNIALNDMVIKNEMSARTSVLNLSINSKPITSYMADGIIISTPTGSTAYSLSAGGPVVSPDIDCFLIVPICPHTLSARPVIVNSNEILTVSISENMGYQITADGQDTKHFSRNVTVEKYENSAKLLLLNKDKSDFYRILRQKLNWGLAPNKC